MPRLEVAHDTDKVQLKMRQDFIETTSRRQAANECPWAAHIIQVCGGYMCFESHDDYKTWCNQK